MRVQRVRGLGLGLMLWLLAGCNLASGATPPPPALATLPSVQLAQLSTPITTRAVQGIPSPSPTENQAAQAPTVCAPAPEATPMMVHTVEAALDYPNKTLQVVQLTRYVNRTGRDLDTLVFITEANTFPGGLVLQTAQADGQTVNFLQESNKLLIALPQALRADCETEIRLEMLIKPPRIGSDILAFKGYFGYSERQLNLALWLPTVAPYVEGWVAHQVQPIGEQYVFEQADWDVSLIVNGASGDLVVAAPGTSEKTAPAAWRFQLAQARDFPMSLSEVYRVQTATARSGTQVEFYSFPDAVRANQQDGAAHALREATQALEQYEALFGPYPYGRLLIVQGDFPDGMEFSGLVFVSTNWFYQWEGGADNFLTVITVHEVSHQWWYARVGNDSAYAPWLDEALATYSEYIYYEEFHPELKNWWWSFRVGYYDPQGEVDSTVYEFATPRDYINAVYLRGVQMLQNLRDTIGTDAFFDLLAEYVAEADGAIATPRLFWSLLTPEQYARTQATREQFLGAPDPLAP